MSLREAVKHAYDKRNEIIILGLTGRTGSGCTTLAKILTCNNYNDLDLRDKKTHGYNSIDERKAYIIDEFMKQDENWKPFVIIDVSSLILYEVFKAGKKELEEYINKLQDGNDNITININGKEDIEQAIEAFDDIYSIINDYDKEDIDDKEIDEYFDFYINKICKFKERFKRLLEGYLCHLFITDLNGRQSSIQYNFYTYFMQLVGNNIRASGNPFKEKFDPQKYTDLPRKISSIIELVKKKYNKKEKHEKIRICIDAIRNPYEALYLRDKYKSFYLVAINTTENDRISRLVHLNKAEKDNLDKVEYASKLKKAEEVFYHQNLQNCIGIADIHIYNPNTKLNKYYELTEQIVKYIALILHPGLITPTAIERCMQIAYDAKLNSVCLSRQVGAVVTRADYSIQGIGWNDVPKGQISCNLRDVHGFCTNKDPKMYSKYELENIDFQKALNEIDKKLIERKCTICVPYCFKDVYNSITGEKNQVHTRALHAEENAFLQVSKYGGGSVKGGFLFTTASPCELCSKKAYQLGIKKIYYIEPYPGISKDHILSFGDSYIPEMILFNGAIGQAYIDFYSPRIPIKDEVELLTGVNVKQTAKCLDEKDNLQYGDIEYKYSLVKLQFNKNRTDVKTVRKLEVKLLKDNIKRFVKYFDWTESSFDSIKLNEYESDKDVKFKVLKSDSPYIYEIAFSDDKKVNDNVKYEVVIKAKDEKKIMEPRLGHYVEFKTEKLELCVSTPDNIIENVRKVVYADKEKKIKVREEKINDEKLENNLINYIFEEENPNVCYYYFIEWDFV